MTDFEKLFDENRDFIFKYLMKMTRDHSLAEELTQESFYRAYMNFASLRDREKAASWLCQIAKNTYFAWYREQKKLTSPEELEDMAKDEVTSVTCHFCDKVYNFTSKDMLNLSRRATEE